MKENVKKELLRQFKDYIDLGFVEKIIDLYYSDIEKSDDNEEMNKELYIITKLQYIIYLNIINRIKNDDIDSEIYLNDKLKPIYLIYLRRNGLDSDERKYSKAIDNVIEKYDGNSSISSCLYKSLTEVYSDNIKKKLL
ncbi:MAG: hypothetical protein IJH20_03705 [Bacilli bacterium]|nr:hypothetical protein [Bacilli bacterium]